MKNPKITENAANDENVVALIQKAHNKMERSKQTPEAKLFLPALSATKPRVGRPNSWPVLSNAVKIDAECVDKPTRLAYAAVEKSINV